MNFIKSQTYFITLSIKKNILPIIFCLFTLSLIIFSKTNILAVKDGLELWLNFVIPSLFPFFIATELLSHTNIISYLGNIFNKFMRPLFNVPGEGSFALLMGIISGYPTGAKIVTDFRQNNICTKVEAERLLAFTNNSGPLFIIGTVGISLFGNSLIGFLLLFTHLLACISVGIIFRFWKRKDDFRHKFNYNSSYKFFIKNENLGSILGESIKNSCNTIIMIGGFIVLFSVIISILNQSKILDFISYTTYPFFNIFKISSDFAKPILSAIIELTNGIKLLISIPYKTISINIILSAFVIGFGSFSVTLQVFSIISKTDISIKPYILGKLLQSILASFYTYLIITNCSLFNFNI